jgi:large subunit ribosomal protein L4
VFDIEPNEAVVHQYIVNYLARQRQGTASTKPRNAVRGGGRKPWRQKGTGRARAGTSRSPLWRGGGTVFGPSPRDYGSKFPKKLKRLAVRSILSDKAHGEKIKIVEELKFDEIKTRAMASVLNNLDLTGKKCLVLDEGLNRNLVLSCRNMQKVAFCRAALTNGYDVMNADYLLLTKAGLDKVEEVFG